MKKLRLTDEQRHIVRVSLQHSDMAIRAFAGTGKTLTLSAIALASQARGAYLVYNAAMRREAEARLPDHVIALTGHSLAFRGVIEESPDYRDKFRRARDGRQISFREIAKVTDCLALQPLSERQAASLILETVKQFQFSADPVIGREHVPMEKIPAKTRAQASEVERAHLQEVAKDNAQKLWVSMANEQSSTPILHDTYVKIFQLRAPQMNAERWLCDEFQDANPVIDSIIRQQEGAQKIYVGDPYQAIYGWRNARDALSAHQNQAHVEGCTLSQSFRFGPQVADMANRMLRARGEKTPLRGVGQPVRPVDPRQPYTVIARNNLSLLDHVTTASQKGKRIAMGVSAGEMAGMVRSAYSLYCNDPGKVKHADLKGYQSWQEFREVARVLDDGVLKGVVRLMETYKSEALTLADRILANKDTQDTEADVTLTTAHRSKGRQWPQVVLADDLHPSKTACQKLTSGAPLTDKENESVNLLYVALTRTQGALSLPGKIIQLLKDIEYVLPKQANAGAEGSFDTQGNQLAEQLAQALKSQDAYEPKTNGCAAS